MENTNETPATNTAETDVPQADTPAVETNFEPKQETAAAPDAKQEALPISSGAGDQDANKKPKSLLDAVKSAARKTAADAASSTVGNNGSSAKDTETKTEAVDDLAADKSKSDADQKLPFHNHPRWKEVVSERDAYRSEAGEYRKITSFMSTNGLSTEEVAEGFQIMALMKTNPAEAHKRISEYKAQLDHFVGEKLPEDLSQKVQDGFVDAETAKENARFRAERDLQQQRQAFAMQQQQVQNQQLMHNAVVNWEQQQKVKDADWSAKQDLVTDQVKLMLATYKPSTPDEAVQLVEQAHQIIRERLSRFAPQRKPVTHVASASSSANAVAQPKSLLEAVRLGAMASR